MLLLLLLLCANATLLGQGNPFFADPNLERAVRDELSKPTGDLTRADLAQLTSLYAPNYRIKTLAGLEGATNLLVLDLTQNDVTNATALAALPQLTSLNLSWNYVHDLAPLLSLTNLTALWLKANALETAPSLGHMTRLARLDLADNRISDLGPLLGLKSLQSLDVSGNPVANLDSLSGLTNLLELNVGNLSLTKLDSLACFTNLTSLLLYQNKFSDIGPLRNLMTLRYVDLSGNPVTDWSPIADLTNLVNLSIREGSVRDLGWLAKLHSLVGLSLNQNAISDLSAVSGLTNLTFLDISQNPVTNYAALAFLPELKVLNLEGNSLRDVSPIAGLHQLVSLSLVWNKIANLDGVAGLTNLSSLSAAFNVLTNISALAELPKLEYVSLHKNLLDLTPNSADFAIIQALESRDVSVSYEPQLATPQILVRREWLLPAAQRSWLHFVVLDGADSQLQRPTVAAHCSNSALIPETSLVTTHSSNDFSWDLSLTPSTGQEGAATLTLAATNYGGLWTNVAVHVEVIAPTPFNGEYVDAAPLAWSTVGAPGWFGQSVKSHDGLSSAQSGATNSWLQTKVTGPGTLRFWYNLQSDSYYGSGQLAATAQDSNLHGYEYLPLRGEIWQEQVAGLPAGEWVIAWSPSWDYWSFGGSNTLWLDQVSFEPGQPDCWLESRPYELPNGQLELHLHGVLGQRYQVEVSADLRNWSTLTEVSCSNFEAPFRDWKTATSRFYRARALP